MTDIPRGVLTALIVSALLSASAALQAADNLNITGALVSEPCELGPDGATLKVSFGTVPDKTLYSETRTKGIPLNVNLINCDLSLGTQATLTFTGRESLLMPGFLVTTGTGSPGVVIGLEQPDGTPVPFNQTSPAYILTDEKNTLSLLAFVAAEPDAIKNNSLTPGDFTATATFEVGYP